MQGHGGGQSHGGGSQGRGEAKRGGGSPSHGGGSPSHGGAKHGGGSPSHGGAKHGGGSPSHGGGSQGRGEARRGGDSQAQGRSPKGRAEAKHGGGSRGHGEVKHGEGSRGHGEAKHGGGSGEHGRAVSAGPSGHDKGGHATRQIGGAPVMVRGGKAVIQNHVNIHERIFVADPGWACGWNLAPAVVVGHPVEIRTVHHVWHDYAYVPVVDPFVRLGCTVELWGGGLGAVLVYGPRQVIVVRDSPEVVIIDNGVIYPDYWVVTPVVYEEALFVPVRPVAASLGISVVASSGGMVVGGGFFFAMW